MKIVLAVVLAILFVACGGGNDDELIGYGNGVKADENIPVDPANGYEIPPPPDVPRYNEYRVSLNIDPAANTVSGISRITFTNRAAVPLETIVLRVYLNAFMDSPHKLMEIQYASLDHESLEFELSDTVLTLVLPEQLKPNATVQLLLQYDAIIPRISQRTGRNDFAMWFGMFLPVLSVFDGEYWHTDAHYSVGHPFLLETANYSVEIVTPLRYTVVGTGLRTEEVTADTKVTRFSAHQARDFSFALSPYFQHAVTQTESGINIHLYHYTDTLDSDEILYMMRQSMEHFEARVGIFPFGHVTIVEANLPHRNASFSQVVFVDSAYLAWGGRYWGVAHGLGNQWFANIVGTNRIAEPWLTEGLTRFVQTGLFYSTPETLRERMEADFVSIKNRTTLYLYRGLYASPDNVHYAHAHGRKAMLMVYSLYIRMGEDVFWEFIAEYFQTFSFGIATVESFISLAEQFYGASLREFFDEWLYTGTVPPLP